MTKKAWWSFLPGSEWWGGTKLRYGTRYGPFKTMRAAKEASVGRFAKMRRVRKGLYWWKGDMSAKVWFGLEEDEGF